MGGKVKYDHIVVVDLEATCYEDNQFPEGHFSEIIEIGACLLSVKTLQVIEKTQIYVKPICSEVSEFCTDLTGITQKKLDDEGVILEEACRILNRKLKTNKRVWASYGEYDRRMFEKQCARENVDYPFNIRHLNIKTLGPIIFGLSKEVGMVAALKSCGLEIEGVHHVGADDAWNTARILKELIRGGAPFK